MADSRLQPLRTGEVVPQSKGLAEQSPERSPGVGAANGQPCKGDGGPRASRTGTRRFFHDLSPGRPAVSRASPADPPSLTAFSPCRRPAGLLRFQRGRKRIARRPAAGRRDVPGQHQPACRPRPGAPQTRPQTEYAQKAETGRPRRRQREGETGIVSPDFHRSPEPGTWNAEQGIRSPSLVAGRWRLAAEARRMINA